MSQHDKDMKTITRQVMMPVRTSGHTGQRDQYEEYTKDHLVTFSGGLVTITNPQSPTRAAITFAPEALQEALKALNYKPGPVYRGADGRSFGRQGDHR